MMFSIFKKALVSMDNQIAEEMSNKDDLGKYILNQLTNHLDEWCYNYRYYATQGNQIDTHHAVEFIHKKSGFKFYYNANTVKVSSPYKTEIGVDRKIGKKIQEKIMDIFKIDLGDQEPQLIKYIKSDFSNSVTIKVEDIYGIKMWLIENTKSRYSVHIDMDTPMTIWFDDPDDAILFKLSHSEGLVEKKPIAIQGYEFG